MRWAVKKMSMMVKMSLIGIGKNEYDALLKKDASNSNPRFGLD